MRYIVDTPVTFRMGVLGLTEMQAQPRLARLRPLGGGLYEVTGEVQFKAGEVIEVEPHATKAQGAALRVADEVMDALHGDLVAATAAATATAPAAPAAKRAPRKAKA